MTDVGLGMIGVGGFGLFCLDKYRLLPGVRIAAVADINEARVLQVQQEYDIPFATTDWRALINRPEVDVVYIATPPALHAEQAIACAQAGKHIFCEKPLAISLEEVDAIFAAAQAHDVRVGTDFVMRYSALYDAVKLITNEKLLGEPLHFVFENTARDLPAGHWFWDPQLSGGIPVEHGVHFFDIFAALYGAGELQWAGRTQRENGAEDKWLMVLKYPERMYGSFYHAFDKPGPIERTWVEIDYTRGAIRLDGWIPELLTLNALVVEDEAERLRELLPGTEAFALPDDQHRILANGVPMLITHRVAARVSAGAKQDIYSKAVQDAMRDFIAWTQNPAHRPRVTGEDGRVALRTALAVTEMARR